MNELALFAGAGGGILGGLLCGFETICAVENDAFCRGVLLSRQNDHSLKTFPIWDDVRTFDGFPWRGLVDVVSGGFPCQDISPAGKGLGLAGPKSGLWKQFVRIIGEVHPTFVLIENSSMLVSRGLLEVLTDLDHLGYDAKWGDIRAEDAIWLQGTPCLDHERKRIWLVCYRRKATGDSDGLQTGKLSRGCEAQIAVPCEPNSPSTDSQVERCREARSLRHRESTEWPSGGYKTASDTVSVGRSETGMGKSSGPDQEDADPLLDGRRQMEQTNGGGEKGVKEADKIVGRASSWWETEPDVDRVVHGITHRVDRLRAIGNMQVPAVVPLAWEALKP